MFSNNRNSKPLFFDKATIVSFILLYFWLLYGTIAIYWSANKEVAIKEIYYLLVFSVLITVIVYLFREIDYLKKFCRFNVIVFLTLLLVSVFEILTGVHLPTSRFVIEDVSQSGFISRATGFFYNENDLSYFLTIYAPFLFVQTVRQKNRIIMLAMYILSLMICTINDSKIALIGFIFQIALFLIVKFWKQKRALLYIVTPILTLIIILFESLTGIFRNQFELISSQISEKYGSVYLRIKLAENGLRNLFNSYLLGNGPGNFQVNTTKIITNANLENPHNWWIEILSNYGVLVFIGFVIVYLYILSRLIMAYRNTKNTNYFKLNNFYFMAILSWSVFSISSLSSSSIFYSYTFWLLWAIILLSIEVYSKSKYLKKPK